MMLVPSADQRGADAPPVPASWVGALLRRPTTHSECAAYHRSTVACLKSEAPLLGASTNASRVPAPDQAGSTERTPRAVGTGVHVALAASQRSTDLVIQA